MKPRKAGVPVETIAAPASDGIQTDGIPLNCKEASLIAEMETRQPVRCLAVVGSKVWTGAKDGGISRRDNEEGHVEGVVCNNDGNPYLRHGNFVSALAYAEGAKEVWAGYGDGFLAVFSENDMNCVFEAKQHSGGIGALLPTFASEYVFSGGEDWIIRKWSGSPGAKTVLAAFSGHSTAVRCLAAPPGLGLLSGSDDGVLHHWCNGLTNPNVIKAHQGALLALLYVPPIHTDRTSELWTGGNDGVCIWAAAAPGCISHTSPNFTLLARASGRQYHTGPVSCLLDIPDTNTVVSMDKQGVVLVWSGHNVAQRISPSGNWQRHGALSACAVTKVASWRLWSCGAEGRIKVWSTPFATEPAQVENLQCALSAARTSLAEQAQALTDAQASTARLQAELEEKTAAAAAVVHREAATKCLQLTHQKELTEVRRKTDDELQAAVNGHSEAIAQLNKSHDEAVAALQETHNEELRTQQKKAEELTDILVHEKAVLQETHRRQLMDLQSDLSAQQIRLAEVLDHHTREKLETEEVHRREKVMIQDAHKAELEDQQLQHERILVQKDFLIQDWTKRFEEEVKGRETDLQEMLRHETRALKDAKLQFEIDAADEQSGYQLEAAHMKAAHTRELRELEGQLQAAKERAASLESQVEQQVTEAMCHAEEVQKLQAALQEMESEHRLREVAETRLAEALLECDGLKQLYHNAVDREDEQRAIVHTLQSSTPQSPVVIVSSPVTAVAPVSRRIEMSPSVPATPAPLPPLPGTTPLSIPVLPSPATPVRTDEALAPTSQCVLEAVERYRTEVEKLGSAVRDSRATRETRLQLEVADLTHKNSLFEQENAQLVLLMGDKDAEVARLQTLAARVVVLEEELVACSSEREAVSARAAVLQEKYDTMGQRLKAKEEETAVLQTEIAHLEHMARESRNHVVELEERNRLAGEELLQLTVKLQDAVGRTSLLEEELMEQQGLLSQFEAELRESVDQRKQQERDLLAEQGEKDAMKAVLEKTESQYLATVSESANMKQQINRLQHERESETAELRTRLATMEEEIAGREGALATLQADLRGETERRRASEGEREALETHVAERARDMSTLQAELRSEVERRRGIELEVSELQHRLRLALREKEQLIAELGGEREELDVVRSLCETRDRELQKSVAEQEVAEDEKRELIGCIRKLQQAAETLQADRAELDGLVKQLRTEKANLQAAATESQAATAQLLQSESHLAAENEELRHTCVRLEAAAQQPSILCPPEAIANKLSGAVSSSAWALRQLKTLQRDLDTQHHTQEELQAKTAYLVDIIAMSVG